MFFFRIDLYLIRYVDIRRDVSNYSEVIVSLIFFLERGFFKMWMIVKYLLIEIVVRVKIDVVNERLERKCRIL